MKISATLKGLPDAHGRRVIAIRINDGTFRKFESTKYRVLPEQFDKGKVAHHPQADMINAALRVKIAKKEIGEDTRVKDMDFKTYIKQFMHEVVNERSYETMRQYKSEVNKIEDFRKVARISHIDSAYLTAYSSHLYNLGNKTNTVWKSFKFLRMLLHRAYKAKVIPENPFDTFSMPKYRDPKKIYLTEDQVQALYEKLPQLADMRFIATWFVIGCYTGLRIGDMAKFSKKNIRSGRLVVDTSKTGEVISMPLSPRVKELFESIQYKPLTRPNNECNLILRGALAACKISEYVSFHCSRHTFATLCAEKGISQEVTSKLLGHRSLRSTGIYYRITNPRIDRELEKLM